MPIRERVSRYYCQHCRASEDCSSSKGFWTAGGCLAHEARCFYNPSRETREGDLYPVVSGNGWIVWPQSISLDPEDDVKPWQGWEPCGEEGDPWFDRFVFLDGAWRRIDRETWECMKVQYAASDHLPALWDWTGSVVLPNAG